MRLVSGVPDLSVLGTSFGSLGSVPLDLVGGTAVQVFQWLVTDLVHSEGAVSGVVAWPVWHFEVTRTHVASSGWWSWSASESALAWRIPWLVPLWWSSWWSISAVHWGRASTIVVRGHVTRSLKLNRGASAFVVVLGSYKFSTLSAIDLSTIT